MEFHDYANIFPSMTNKELEELAENIKSKGLFERITLFDGRIIDGRNRYKACIKAGVEPQYQDLPDNVDPLDYVCAMNLKRRQLSTTQKAICAAKLANMRRGEFHGNRYTKKDSSIRQLADTTNEPANNNQQPEPKKEEPKPEHKPVSMKEAVDKFKTSRRSAERVKHVIDNGTQEVYKALENEEISITKAEELANLPKTKQNEELSKIKINRNPQKSKKPVKERERKKEPKEIPKRTKLRLHQARIDIHNAIKTSYLAQAEDSPVKKAIIEDLITVLRRL